MASSSRGRSVSCSALGSWLASPVPQFAQIEMLGHEIRRAWGRCRGCGCVFEFTELDVKGANCGLDIGGWSTGGHIVPLMRWLREKWWLALAVSIKTQAVLLKRSTNIILISKWNNYISRFIHCWKMLNILKLDLEVMTKMSCVEKAWLLGQLKGLLDLSYAFTEYDEEASGAADSTCRSIKYVSRSDGFA